MIDYIAISTLNDFIFCPYSIYFHNVYMDTDETMYHATPQTRGRSAHETVDKKTASNRADDILSLPVYSEEYGLMGKIDVYKRKERKLIERKYQLKQIYQGQIYQLWAQMLCLEEMGYAVEELAFYEISANKMIPIKKPDNEELRMFRSFIERFRNYNPEETPFTVNPNKCRHCIYCSLCDKTTENNVYQ
ncbi:type V CRISPR-associated protein Cas4 [Xylanibacter muris]|uniref:Type V CRISPR-associated protein Cas4 n=1 Tax=Xylanibacter muris TaxID=2736290 RepID=A0ABX2AP24_9BACT|nr:type V CRISPR-associated protein Cas4 [Xylanibacter muris]NPD92993.1 type V CRISPR-associated protein Cas4 [Xylanibacter muris]